MAQKMKRYDEALADYTVVLDRDPRNIWALNQRAVVYAERQDYLNAIADVSRSIELRPGSWNLRKRGQWYAAQSKWAEARADYTSALEYNSMQWYIYWRRAEALARLGDFAAAVSDYEQYIAHEPDPEWRTRAEHWKFVRRGQWYAAQSKWAEAVADYTVALERDSQRYLYWWRAKALEQLGDLAAAISDYERYIAHDPDPKWRTRAEQQIAKLKA